MTETRFLSYFQELDNALVTPLPAVIKVYVTLRDAKLTNEATVMDLLTGCTRLPICGRDPKIYEQV